MTKEEEILIAAEDEFFRNGYDATSTATIAKRAGVTHAMVNYYYRTKEQLFIKFVDTHVTCFLESIKKVMHADGDFIRIMEEAVTALFDQINLDRKFPFIVLDITRTHPELLERYRETMSTICQGSIERHSRRLAEQIRAGKIVECSMEDIYLTVIHLAVTPFLDIPFLENIAGYDKDRIERHLLSRREDMVETIRRKYLT
ncbi:TetR/AcrR family transcriptional regulator [Proteiniphilum sp. X52]|uniref:TetR/AcrR family transcriptional regulator n=1 Tax=Proteiniphilum sp. X52 TaxID=2382159 RepID=UPI000F0A1932|nr:TetR/AcrR family transcriptional regulator [Proteiniphilum sp. X52]RNC65544.1 TetR/AcrR family transcriptional regulator [Proteiniphilum sp. X52]